MGGDDISYLDNHKLNHSDKADTPNLSTNSIYNNLYQQQNPPITQPEKSHTSFKDKLNNYVKKNASSDVPNNHKRSKSNESMNSASKINTPQREMKHSISQSNISGSKKESRPLQLKQALSLSKTKYAQEEKKADHSYNNHNAMNNKINLYYMTNYNDNSSSQPVLSSEPTDLSIFETITLNFALQKDKSIEDNIKILKKSYDALLKSLEDRLENKKFQLETYYRNQIKEILTLYSKESNEAKGNLPIIDITKEHSVMLNELRAKFDDKLKKSEKEFYAFLKSITTTIKPK